MIDNRARLLDAAAKVYAEYGYRGATTRRIAVAAGVNEVTLFRTFGSKAALLDEALCCRAASVGAGRAMLPAEPHDPERELTEWATVQLERFREAGSLLRKSLSELEERPEGPCVAHAVADVAEELRAYMRRLADVGLVDWSALDEDELGRQRARRRAPAARRDALRSEDAHAAGTMLVSALFGDAMGRSAMPGLYPEPVDRAPALYVRLFLRAIRCAPAARRIARATATQTRS